MASVICKNHVCDSSFTGSSPANVLFCEIRFVRKFERWTGARVSHQLLLKKKDTVLWLRRGVFLIVEFRGTCYRRALGLRQRVGENSAVPAECVVLS